MVLVRFCFFVWFLSFYFPNHTQLLNFTNLKVIVLWFSAMLWGTNCCAEQWQQSTSPLKKSSWGQCLKFFPTPGGLSLALSSSLPIFFLENYLASSLASTLMNLSMSCLLLFITTSTVLEGALRLELLFILYWKWSQFLGRDLELFVLEPASLLE